MSAPVTISIIGISLISCCSTLDLFIRANLIDLASGRFTYNLILLIPFLRTALYLIKSDILFRPLAWMQSN